MKDDDYDISSKKCYELLQQDKNNYKINLDGDWFAAYYDEHYKNDDNIEVDILKIKLAKLEIDYLSDRLKIEQEFSSSTKTLKREKEFKIDDLFYVNCEEYIKNIDVSKFVNVVAALKRNNGVKHTSLMNKKTIEGNKIVLVTGGAGGAGLAFYQKEPFIRTSQTCCLTPKPEFLLDEFIGIYCACELSKYKSKYTRGYGWTLEKIKTDTINLPITSNGEIDYILIRDLCIKKNF